MSAIAKALAAIQTDVQPIAKDRENRQQGYKFRGIDQVADMLHPLLAKHGVVVLPRVLSQERSEHATKSGGTMYVSVLTIAWHFTATDGSELVVVTVGEGADSGDKASNKAMTAAQKYALTLTFTIPWADQAEGDSESPERGKRQRAPTQRQQMQVADAASKPVGAAASAPMPAGWYDERIGFGKHKDWTWRELVVGKEPDRKPAEPGGGRWSWLEYMVKQLDLPTATERDAGVLVRVRKTMEAISKQADARAAQQTGSAA